MSSREPSDFINSDLFKSSLHNEDFVLDYEIEMEGVVAAVKGMRNGKSSGADGISAEHLKHGGPGICAWLKRIFNSIITLESIPPSLNHSLICPIFKGKGRDPTNPGNYRGISLTSVIAKEDNSVATIACPRRKWLPSSSTDSLHQESFMCRWNFYHE